MIKLIVAILLFVAVIKIGDAMYNSIKSESDKVNACLFNPAYQGITPEDTRALYNQCKADYKDSH